MAIKYVRPSGSKIEVSDTPDNRAYAEKNGWVEHKASARKKAKSKAK